MTQTDASSDTGLTRLAWPLRLTRAGLVAERATRAFWPLWTILLLALAALMLGAFDVMGAAGIWATTALTGLALVAALWYGLRRFAWPDRAAAEARLDATLPGRPIAALTDHQAIGATDDASRAVWQAHQDRMRARAAAAKPVAPDLRLADRDPYALRFVAVLGFAVAVLFGSFWKVAAVGDAMAGGQRPGALAVGPAWEGWIEPPTYTNRPSLYLADLAPGPLSLPEGSRITLRLYGELGALQVEQSVSGPRPAADQTAPAAAGSEEFEVLQDGTLAIVGPGGAEWQITVLPDAAPTVRPDGVVERAADGEMSQPFAASDDYAVIAGTAEVQLNMAALDRRYGHAADPDPREPIVLDLPMPITGDRAEFSEVLIENLSKHPWVGLPVTMRLTVEDARGQTGQSELIDMALPGRRFFDPLASAVAEQRRDLLWARDNGARVSQVLRAISHLPEGFIRDESAYLMLRVAIRRLEAGVALGLEAELQEEVAEALWDIAVLLEEGDLSSALERLRRAQEQLAEAMKNGASPDEINELMQELREATQDYLRQLAQQQRQDGGDQQMSQNQQQMQEITSDELQALMDRIQELMEQGRMAEAQELMQRLNELLENLQVAEGGQGGGQQSPGEQAMQDLADTLRQQQGLSDEAFRELQEQFNPNAQAGQSGENSGQSGGEGRGQSHDGQGGTGEGQEGSQDGQGAQGGAEALAQRQQALRDELSRQQGNLPAPGTAEGDAAREALDRAGEAMDGAEEALRNDDLAEALDHQADAMEALREGMRSLGEALAQQQQQNQPGQQGEAMGRANQRSVDPLGRDSNGSGQIGTDERLLQGEDVYRRARELLDEIRRRSGEQSRPEDERDYLNRLLDRF